MVYVERFWKVFVEKSWNEVEMCLIEGVGLCLSVLIFVIDVIKIVEVIRIELLICFVFCCVIVYV